MSLVGPTRKLRTTKNSR